MKKAITCVFCILLLGCLLGGCGESQVEILIPAYLAWPQTEEAADAQIQEDGSVALQVTEEQRAQWEQDAKNSIDSLIDEYVESQDTPSIRKITYNDAITEFTMEVDKAAYEKSLDAMALSALGTAGCTYQVMAQNPDPAVTIHVVDAESGEEFATGRYPEDFT